MILFLNIKDANYDFWIKKLWIFKI